MTNRGMNFLCAALAIPVVALTIGVFASFAVQILGG